MAIKIQGTEVINNNREADFYRYVKISGGDDPRIEIGPENGETQSFSIRHANNRLEFGQHDGTNNYNQVNIDSTGKLNARVGMSIQGGALELNGAATKTFSIRGTDTPGYDHWTDTGWAGGSVTNWNSGQNVELELKVKQSFGQDVNYGHVPGSDTDTGFETKGFTHIGGITLQWGCTGYTGDIGNDALIPVTFAIPWEGIQANLPEVMSITTGMLTDRPGFNDNIDGNVGVADLTKTGFNFRFDEWGSLTQNTNFCYQAIGHTDLSYVDHHD